MRISINYFPIHCLHKEKGLAKFRGPARHRPLPLASGFSRDFVLLRPVCCHDMNRLHKGSRHPCGIAEVFRIMFEYM
ncbi:MAG: hypothetical protein A2W52_00185 [Candidatus Taylorbacteria bacterium RIFCSPHIGHO2_02_49_25]|uniref:Uncharacterized protein n=1 Tax=Candidatus Taylorbacteria bacterium RIFCSPHIGHO2_02_49_25 TaxID=1802305 RepID=A0A1G2MGT3_9BACT|nr:MAG: hypothetical protein A2W52_00185 [Candidatus Taylorbacteria bacterium RIFCSPHIGHO2_02_49_25]OHA35505.1 MAG: hypothetical protein A3B27_00300 [Candidatus Taylorbacteria bacterium RIFCSPLOWO2_01_FULL_50_130]OHA35587.1 MAG: hypothetical protein A2W65_00825 [Candidatus Taylorbacteria bacterium RIFCSPLOWO2_02_50_13]OHA40826.1 MAG: hypothetical protein A3H73_00500 [Candidatus Taylorbacteria bacterium RIFCSPLOWO2_02_FULL_50_120]OHA47208.1 MAG: hypothetical protein A3G61_00260 [Candidatus Taylo